MKLFILFLLSTFSLLGQSIKGKVIDIDTKVPIENVSVYLENLKKGTTTNKKGLFHLKSNFNHNVSDSITFSIIGYYSKKIILSKLKKQNFIVNLSKKTEQLREITVHSNQGLKKEISFRKLKPIKKGVHSFGSVLIGDYIYLVSGDGSYIEDIGKKALLEVQSIAQSTVNDLIKRLLIKTAWERYMGNLFVYNIENNEWSKSDLDFRKRAYHNINLVDDNIYVLGGKRISVNQKKEYLDETIEVYNLKKDSIILDKTNPHQAVNFASFNYNKNLIIMGGSTKINKKGKKTYTNKSHLFNLESGYWYELKKMTKAKEVKGVLINNTIYLIGGFNGKPLSEIESYSINSGEWKNEGHLFNGIANPSLTYFNDTIYIFNDSKILTYNISTKILNEYNIHLNLKASKIHYYKNKLYIIGGYIENEYSKIPSSQTYSIDLLEFETTEVQQSKKM